MLVHHFLEDSAARHPSKTALVCDDRRWTYRQLNSMADGVAGQLRAGGIRRGDRVCIQLQNSVEAVAAIFAILKAGAVFVVLNPTTKAAKVRHIINDSGARCFMTSSAGGAGLQRAVADCPGLDRVMLVPGSPSWAPTPGKVLEEFSMNASRDRPDGEDAEVVRCIDADLASLIYTSGSTGEPKGVMLTHLNMVCAAESITGYLQNTSEDVILNVLPLSFDYGLYQVLMSVKLGATVILETSFAYPGQALRKISQEGVTGFPVVPTMLAVLFQFELHSSNLQSLRYMTSTGAVLPMAHVKRLRALLPHVRFYSMYGLTECKRVSYLSPDKIDKKPDSVGQAMENVEVFVVNEEGGPVGCETVGELVVRGSTVMRGYWGDQQATDRVLRPGFLPGERFLHTGDLFRMDSDGDLFFIGRMDDMIKSRGEKVSPKEVEGVLCALEGVLEAAVVGVDDATLGQAIKAVVRVAPQSGLDERAILRHCSRHLENFMVPQRVEIRSELPRTAAGKVDRRALVGK